MNSLVPLRRDGLMRRDYDLDHSCPRCGFSTAPPFGSLLPPRVGARPWVRRRPWHLPSGFPGGLETWDRMGCQWHRIVGQYSDHLTGVDVTDDIRMLCEEVHEYFLHEWPSKRVHPADTRRIRRDLRHIADWLEDNAVRRGLWMFEAAARVRELRRSIPSDMERYYPEEDWVDGVVDGCMGWESEYERPWGRRGGRRHDSPLDRPWLGGRRWPSMLT